MNYEKIMNYWLTQTSYSWTWEANRGFGKKEGIYDNFGSQEKTTFYKTSMFIFATLIRRKLNQSLIF